AKSTPRKVTSADMLLSRRQVVAEPARREVVHQAVGGDAEQPENQDRREHVAHREPLARLDNAEADAAVRGDQLGADHRGEGITERDPRARDAVTHGGGKYHPREELPPVDATALGAAQYVAADG